MKKHMIQMLLMAMCVLFVACGKEKAEVKDVQSIVEAENDGEQLENEMSLSKNQIAAQEIIALAESYNTTDNAYNEEIGYEKYKDFFLDEYDAEAYQLVLDDLEKKTGSAHKQIEKFYDSIDALFTEDCTAEIVNQLPEDAVLFHYFHQLTRNYQKAYSWVICGAIGGGVNVHSEQDGAAWTAGGDWIYYGEMTMYLPYYIYENLYTDKEISIDDMVNEIFYMGRSKSFLADMDYDIAYDNNDWSAYEYNVVVDKIPLFSAMMWMGRKYDTFSELAEHELFFSPSITTQDDYWDYDWFNGTVNSAYVIHFYDKTANLYGEAGFTSDNKLMGLYFWEEPGTVFWETEVEKEPVQEENVEENNEVNEKIVQDTQMQEERDAYETEETEEIVVDGGNTTDDNTASGTTTAITGANTSGGIVFEHIHTWEHIEEKVADGYMYTDMRQEGYNCGACGHIFSEYTQMCPSCTSTCINNNYVFEDKMGPAKYRSYDLCRSCGSVANNQIFEK